MRKLHWEVRLTKAPSAIRYCKRCGKKREFGSSGLFRVNAQHNNLDIWLIYKCRVCDTTWKLEIYSRINPRYLKAELLYKYTNNDSGLANLHASDINLIRKNVAECGSVEFEVAGDDYGFNEPVEILITPEFAFDLKLSTVLREKLKLSRSAFDRLVKNGNIYCTQGQDIQKYKIRDEIIIVIKP